MATKEEDRRLTCVVNYRNGAIQNSCVESRGKSGIPKVKPLIALTIKAFNITLDLSILTNPS
jgi:hypothetical protein